MKKLQSYYKKVEEIISIYGSYDKAKAIAKVQALLDDVYALGMADGYAEGVSEDWDK